jgi:hypothetical protein
VSSEGDYRVAWVPRGYVEIQMDTVPRLNVQAFCQGMGANTFGPGSVKSKPAGGALGNSDAHRMTSLSRLEAEPTPDRTSADSGTMGRYESAKS